MDGQPQNVVTSNYHNGPGYAHYPLVQIHRESACEHQNRKHKCRRSIIPLGDDQVNVSYSGLPCGEKVSNASYFYAVLQQEEIKPHGNKEYLSL